MSMDARHAANMVRVRVRVSVSVRVRVRASARVSVRVRAQHKVTLCRKQVYSLPYTNITYKHFCFIIISIISRVICANIHSMYARRRLT